ncbi:hypothetical protein D3C77_331450 [compost metagenome]
MASKSTKEAGWLTWARKSMSETIRLIRSSSSVQDSSTSRYSSGDLSLVSATWALPIRLERGARSSCARSSENCESCCTPSSKRASMILIPSASSFSSAGIPLVGSRCSRLSVEIFDATFKNLVSGNKPRRTVHQPMTRISARRRGDTIRAQVNNAFSRALLELWSMVM